MEDAAILAIGVVASMVAMAALYSYINGPLSPLAKGWRRRLNELEVSTRMGSGEEIIQALRESAKIYQKLGKRWEAETALRRAMLIAKQEYGESYPGLPDVMDDFARVMDSMHRKKEAEQMRKEAQKVRQKFSKR
jgi:hypothetical protein